MEARDIGVAWTLEPLLNKHLRLSQLSVATLNIEDHRTDTSTDLLVPPPACACP